MNSRYSLHIILILIVLTVLVISVPVLTELSFGAPGNKPSPANYVPESQLVCLDRDKEIVVDLGRLNIPFTRPPKVWSQGIPDTDSMNPVLDAGHNIVLIGAADADNQKILCDALKVGDICTYSSPQGLLLHRIVDISFDEEGRKFTFKGDNNWTNDPWVTRDSQINSLCIAIVY